MDLLAQFFIALLVFGTLHFLAGRLHWVSFCLASFIALGQFAFAHLWLAAPGLSTIILGPLIAGLLCALAALPLGYLLRQCGPTLLAISTLAAAELLFLVAPLLPALFATDSGLALDRGLAGALWRSPIMALVPIALYLLVIVIAAYSLWHSAFERNCRAVRDDPQHARRLNLRPPRIRLIAFTLSAGIAGIAGALGAWWWEFVALDSLNPHRSLQWLVFCFLFADRLWRIPAAALLYSGAQLLLPQYTVYTDLWLGLAFVIVMYQRLRVPTALFNPEAAATHPMQRGVNPTNRLR